MPGIHSAWILPHSGKEMSLSTYTNRRTPVNVVASWATDLPRIGARSAAAPATPTVRLTPLTCFLYVGTAVWSAVTLIRATLVASTSPLNAVISPRRAGTATTLRRLLRAALAMAEASRACSRNSWAPNRLRMKSAVSRRDRTRRSGWTPIRAGREGGLPDRRGRAPPAPWGASDLRPGFRGAAAEDLRAGRVALPPGARRPAGLAEDTSAAEARVGRALPDPAPRVCFTSSPLCWLERTGCHRFSLRPPRCGQGWCFLSRLCHRLGWCRGRSLR